MSEKKEQEEIKKNRKRVLEKEKARWKTWSKATKVYFFSAIVVSIVSFLASILSLSLPMVPLDVSPKILESVIRLDGVLFGFTAVMLSLVYREIRFRNKKFSNITTKLEVFSVTSFLCYLLSIFMSFSFLMNQTRGNEIFVPVILTCFGGLCSSIYVVFSIIEIEEE